MLPHPSGNFEMQRCYQNEIRFIIFLDSTKLKIVWIKITHGLLYLHGPKLCILKEKIVGQIFQF